MGLTKKTPADYREIARQRCFRWLGPAVPTTATPTTWECPHGHRWAARYKDVQRGSGCPLCAGNIPRTPADYHALAAARGLEWLGPPAVTNKDATWWACPQGHRWAARYNNIQQGTGCPACAGNTPRGPADYESLAAARGFRWLGPGVGSVRAKTRWACARGHEWAATYNAIAQGSGCPICSRHVPKTPADYAALAAARGYRWLGPAVRSVDIPTEWMCAQGHRWRTSYSALAQGRGCPHCAGNAPKTPADYHALAAARGFRWVGPAVPNGHTKTTWECAEGHQWAARYHDLQRGAGCPLCAGCAPKIAADYHALAAARGFRWLGPEAPTVTTKTVWECPQGHQWEAHYNNIQQGSGCPQCADMVEGVRVSQPQRALAALLGGALNYPAGRYRIDVALDPAGERIAVEYDSWYWHAGAAERDSRRDRVLRAAGWRILRIRANGALPGPEELAAALKRLRGGVQAVEIVLDDWGEGPVFAAGEGPAEPQGAPRGDAPVRRA